LFNVKINNMSWNHRILVHGSNNEFRFEIHEVYYNDAGEPYAYSAEGTRVCGGNLKEVSWALKQMEECTKKPILWAGNKFPGVYRFFTKNENKEYVH